MSNDTEMQVLAGLIVNSLNEVSRSRQLYAAGFNKSGNTKRHHLWCEFGYPECSAAKFFAPKRIKLCTAATERNTDIAHSAN
ncbi:hypothetical protein [Enterobacter asburiae]|uniref:hypothetical protein n=1 Tax=Enterobacter asburiae TaxID=61645 RepID=UPI002FFCBD35